MLSRRRSEPAGVARRQRSRHGRPSLRHGLRPQRRDRPVALVAGRQRRQADRALRQLLPDPARRGVAAVGHRLSRCAWPTSPSPRRSARRRAPGRWRRSSPRSASSRPTSAASRSRTPTATMSAMSTCSRSSTLLIQKAELDWAFAAGQARRRSRRERPIRKLEGDLDVFGDGSVTIIVDAGPHAGPPVAAGAPAQDRLAGAVAAMPPTSRTTGTTGASPSMNTSAEQTQASLQAASPICWRDKKAAALDQPRQAAKPGQKHSPQFYD